MVKICPNHGVMLVRFDFCPDCGIKLWEITEGEFMRAWEYEHDDKDANEKWIKWLQDRHPEFSMEIVEK